jgi:DNA-binding beta-propeller fold protein YncE
MTFWRFTATVSGATRAILPMLLVWYLGTAEAADSRLLEKIATLESKGKAGTLDHLFVDSSTSRLFLTNQTNDTLDVFDLKSNQLLRQVSGQKTAHSVVYVPELNRIFVGCGGGFCNVLDGRSYMVVKSIPVEGADSVRFDSRTGHVGVASHKSLTLIDGKSLEVIAQVALPGTPHGFQIAKSGTAIYVNSEPPTQVAVVSPENKAVVNNYALVGEHKSVGPITLDEPNGRILVGLRAQPRLAVLDLASGKEVATAPIPEGADDMFLDPESKLIYVTSSTGFISVIRQIDADHYEHLADLTTVRGAKTSGYDPIQKRLYVAVPRQEGKEGPEIWVYQSRP